MRTLIGLNYKLRIVFSIHVLAFSRIAWQVDILMALETSLLTSMQSNVCIVFSDCITRALTGCLLQQHLTVLAAATIC